VLLNVRRASLGEHPRRRRALRAPGVPGAAAGRILCVTAAVLAAHGCGVSLDHQECDGETTACELRIAAVDCISGDGCTWGTQCTPIDCNSRAASRCTFPQCHPDSEACGWANSYIGLPDCTATLTTNCLPPLRGRLPERVRERSRLRLAHGVHGPRHRAMRGPRLPSPRSRRFRRACYQRRDRASREEPAPRGDRRRRTVTPRRQRFPFRRPALRTGHDVS